VHDSVIHSEGLGKRYRLGEREMYRTFGETLTRAARSRLGRNSASPKSREEHLWALSDVSFDVGQGEVVGIVGANGAGKSTLLKILSRITRPSAGEARLRGRVASLLEVGTGFHLELTGRDNVYLNGGVLGMSRQEIARKFDEIVDFAGVERFLDTPVKRYSSGMLVRLGFAVAAHLEPEILIVDEVLAVGDAEFQRRCLGKIDDVAREGRTVLFVSHNMNAVQRLCSRSLAFQLGHLVRDGATSEVVAWYLAEASATHAGDGWLDALQLPRQGGSGQVRVVGVSCSAGDESATFQPHSEGPLKVRLLLESDAERTVGSVAVMISDQLGTKLVNADSIKLGKSIEVRRGRTVITVDIQALHLTPGTYVLGWWIADPLGIVHDFVERALHVEVADVVDPGLGIRPRADGAVTCDFDVMSEPET
jgi:ABC-type polysaccharide/polyol phosphate transport system ATPase subunit